MTDINVPTPPVPPEKCPVVLVLGDDTGKYSCTMHCDLPKGHANLHQERGNQVARNGTGRAVGISYYTMTWGDPAPNTR
jgi:hypothetical protein